jgi:hypothetical protein
MFQTNIALITPHFGTYRLTTIMYVRPLMIPHIQLARHHLVTGHDAEGISIQNASKLEMFMTSQIFV